MECNIISEYISKGGQPKYIEIIEVFSKTLPNKPGMINIDSEGVISLKSNEEEKTIIQITPINENYENQMQITYNKVGKDNIPYSFICVVGENKKIKKFDGYITSEEGEWIITIVNNQTEESAPYIEIDYFDNEARELYNNSYERDDIPDAITTIDSIDLETIIEIINNPEMYLRLSKEFKRRTK